MRFLDQQLDKQNILTLFTVYLDFLHNVWDNNIVAMPNYLMMMGPHSYSFSYSSYVINSVGREAEHGWNIWASKQFLSGYNSISTRVENGPMKEQPRQYYHLLKAANLSTEIAFYHHTFQRIQEKNSLAATAVETLDLASFEIPTLHAGKY